MILRAIILFLGIGSPVWAQAGGQTDQDQWPMFTKVLWGATEERCPVEADAYSLVYDPDELMEGTNSDTFGGLSVIPGMGVVALDEPQRWFAALAIIAGRGVVDQLVYQSFFGDEQDGSDTEEGIDIFQAREHASVSLALMDCMWPTNNDLEVLAGSRSDFGSAARSMMVSACEIQFFTMYQRFVDFPVETISSDELLQRGKQILEEHNEYLDAYFETNDCEEFT